MRGGRGWFRTLGAAVCVAILLVASTVEAAHFCDLGGGRTAVQRSSEGPGGAEPNLCLICATAHLVSMSAPAAHAVPNVAAVASTRTSPVQSRSRRQVFTMDVRPPPAA